MNRHADNLYEELTLGHPAPWSVTYDRHYPKCIKDVTDSGGGRVLHLATHTGDGDQFDLGTPGAMALVKFVNGYHADVVADNEAEGEIQGLEGSQP